MDWIDDPDSRVDIVRTPKEDLRGVVRLARGLLSGRIAVDRVRAELVPSQLVQPAANLPSPLSGVPRGMMGQLVRFGAIGVLSSLAYLVLYLGLREFTGAQWANLVALLVTAIADTAVNRKVTFRVQGRANMLSTRRVD